MVKIMSCKHNSQFVFPYENADERFSLLDFNYATFFCTIRKMCFKFTDQQQKKFK